MHESEPVAAARRALGRQLAELRIAAGLTQHDLAALVHYSRTTLANVETGRQQAARDFWEQSDRAVGAAGTLLATFDSVAALLERQRRERSELEHVRRFGAIRPAPAITAAQMVAEDGDVERREFLRVLSMAGVGLSLPVLDAAPRPAEVTLDQYTAMNASLWQVFGMAKSKQLAMPLVREQLSTLTGHLREPQTEATHQQLCALTGELLQLAGEIQFDGNRYADAAQTYTLAAMACREADAFDLWATAMVRHSFLSLYDGKPAEAGPMLEAAGQLAHRGDSALSTRYWVAAVRAQALAGVGDLDGCERALAKAEQVNGSTSPGGWLRFDATRLPEERGACYVELHRPELAEAALTVVLGMDVSARRRGSVLVDLATTGVQRGDPDRVVDYATQAIELANETGSGWVAQKLRGLQAQLQPMMGDSRIRALNAAIR